VDQSLKRWMLDPSKGVATYRKHVQVAARAALLLALILAQSRTSRMVAQESRGTTLHALGQSLREGGYSEIAQAAQNPAGQNAGQNPSASSRTSGQGTESQGSQTSSTTQGGQVGQVGSPPTLPQNRSNSVVGTAQIPGAAKTTSGPSTLSLEQAIQLAIQNNLATLEARERRNEAEGLRQQSLSRLLPNISGTAYQASLTENLAAIGFKPGLLPGFGSTFIGPFNNFDARANLVQTIFNLSSILNYQAGRAGVRIARLQEELAREQVATGVALNYLEALRAERSVSAAEANVDLAQTLLQLARDQRSAGVATGIDVTRAQTRLAEEQVRLAQSQTTSEQAQLNLLRVIGLPLETRPALTDQLRFNDESMPSVENAVGQAAQNRREVQVAEEQVRLTGLERKAVHAEYLPYLEFLGDYGVSGITPAEKDLPTRRVAIQVNVPIFNGGLTRGRLTVATSRERQAELELGNIRGQVEEDVRLALFTLKTAAAQVRAADETLLLAQRELEMARDRFRAGVADNLEVVNAQTALANARDAQTTALAQYNVARLNLAAALGRAEAFHW
jgi:outer membrane protein